MLQLGARPKAIRPDFLVVMCVAEADAGDGRTGSCLVPSRRGDRMNRRGVDHAARWRGGRLAARSAGAADESANDRRSFPTPNRF